VNLMIDAVQHPDWPKGIELVVVGAGANEKKVQDAERRGLPVRWLGYKPYEQIPSLVAGAIAGLIPITNPSGRSSTGISPLKLYETLACGVPAVVTDLPGQAEVVREGDCGIVIPCDDAPALAQAVARLARDPATTKEMGKRAAEFVFAHHSWAARAREIDGVLQNMLKRNAPTARRSRGGPVPEAARCPQRHQLSPEN
jgi:glycosyltransferase involved in cell wall biosynthesis